MGPGHKRTDEQNGTGKVLKRRGLIAGAAALMAGIVAKQTAQHVGAVPPYAAGSIPFADGSGNLTQDTPNLSWDATVPGLRVGQGTSQYLFNTYTGRRLEIKDGGGPVSPVTTAGPTLKVSRTENYPSPVGGNSVDNEANAAIYGISANTANSAQQVNGVYGAAISNSGLKTDAVGLTGIGQTRVGNGVGTGLYAEGRRDSGTASAVGAEIRASNMQGGNVDYVANGFSPVMGLWVTCGAHPNPLRCGAGIALRGVPPDGQPPSAGISQWDVGIGSPPGVSPQRRCEMTPERPLRIT